MMPGGVHYLYWLAGTLMLAGTLLIAQPDLDRMQHLAGERYGSETALLVDQWRTLIEEIRTLEEDQKLVAVNDFFNDRIEWTQDPDIWGKEDYWATPLETMGKRAGDCEDFAIAKYATLILSGVDIDKLRITYVKAQLGAAYGQIHTAHMVLAYYATPGAEPMILDNLITEVRPASRRQDLTPVYGFNSRGLWVGGAVNPATTEPGAKLSRWRDLLQRAAAEGLG